MSKVYSYNVHVIAPDLFAAAAIIGSVYEVADSVAGGGILLITEPVYLGPLDESDEKPPIDTIPLF